MTEWLHVSPLVRLAVVCLWLLPAGVQDWRSRNVSNWLTVPALVITPVVALLVGSIPLFIGFFIVLLFAYYSFTWGLLDAADAKVMVVLSVLAPEGLIVSLVMIGVALLITRLKGQRNVQVPLVSIFAAGTMLALPIFLLWPPR